MFLLDLQTDFSGARSGGLVFPSLEEFLTVVIHTVKGFGIVNKTEVDVFLELSCFFYVLTDVGNLISGFSAFSKSSLYWFIILPPILGLRPFFLGRERNIVTTTKKSHSRGSLKF